MSRRLCWPEATIEHAGRSDVRKWKAMFKLEQVLNCKKLCVGMWLGNHPVRRSCRKTRGSSAQITGVIQSFMSFRFLVSRCLFIGFYILDVDHKTYLDIEIEGETTIPYSICLLRPCKEGCSGLLFVGSICGDSLLMSTSEKGDSVMQSWKQMKGQTEIPSLAPVQHIEKITDGSGYHTVTLGGNWACRATTANCVLRRSSSWHRSEMLFSIRRDVSIRCLFVASGKLFCLARI